MRIVIIGAGAAGLMTAANINAPALVLERNEKAGKKIYITGKGRCNLTNNVAPAEFLKSVVCGDKFVQSCVYRFSPSYVINFFEENGLKLKTERGNRVFPVSDKASDVTKTLVNKIISKGSIINYHSLVKDIKHKNNEFEISLDNGENIFADIVVVATGGKSYPFTGSDVTCIKFLPR